MEGQKVFLRHTVVFGDFFLQKKRITAIIWFGLAVLTQISLRETSDNRDVMCNISRPAP